jgi:hypothetical protein
VEFAEGSGPGMLVGSGSAVATRHGREAGGRAARLVGPVVESRNLQAVCAKTRRGQPHATSGRIDSRAPHMGAEPSAACGSGVRRVGVDFVFLGERRMQQ